MYPNYQQPPQPPVQGFPNVGYDNGGYYNNNNGYDGYNSAPPYHDHQLQRQNSNPNHQALTLNGYQQSYADKRKSIRHVELVNGNLVFDSPVPDKVLQSVKSQTKEFTHMTYTAVTCDPDDFSKTWGKEGWKKVVVVVVADGRNKVNQRVLKVLGAMGVYQEGIMQDSVAGQPVTGHLFEYTSNIMVDNEFNIAGQENPP
ncbi:6435_t:CDS:2, partial [Funneliformis caledonium]